MLLFSSPHFLFFLFSSLYSIFCSMGDIDLSDLSNVIVPISRHDSPVFTVIDFYILIINGNIFGDHGVPGLVSSG